MSDKHQYWLVGANFDGEDMSDIFIRRGYWELGWNDSEQPAMADKRNSIKPGDRIAIKSMLGRGSTKIKIKALGIVQEIGEDKRVYVDWKLKGLKREVESGGAYASIHGPYSFKEKEFEKWLSNIFLI